MDVSQRLAEERALVAEFLASPAQRWDRVQEPLDKGIKQGLNAADRNYASCLSPEDKNDIYATAIEKAFKGLLESKWQGKAYLQHWAYRIGYHAAVDVLRQRNRNPLHMAKPLQKDDASAQQASFQPQQKANAPHVADPVETPEEQLVQHQKRERLALLRGLVMGWAEPERTMGLALLNGEASSLTAAARVVAGQGHKMYLTKARALLQRRLRDFQDLA